MMFNSILAGAFLIVLTVVVHATFMTSGLPFLLRRERASGTWLARHHSFLIAFTVLWFSLAHLVEITLWATTYMVFEQFPNFETALYFSAVTFTTLGYGDVVLDEAWRLLSSFEAINGIILVGWTTAIIIGVSRHVFAGHPAKTDGTP